MDDIQVLNRAAGSKGKVGIQSDHSARRRAKWGLAGPCRRRIEFHALVIHQAKRPPSDLRSEIPSKAGCKHGPNVQIMQGGQDRIERRHSLMLGFREVTVRAIHDQRDRGDSHRRKKYAHLIADAYVVQEFGGVTWMLVFSIGTIILEVPFGALSRSSFKAVPFLTQLFAATAYQLSWSIYVSDYSRYLPRNVGVAASFLWTYFGALLGGAWMMEVGALVAVMNPHLEVAAAVLKSGDTVVHGLGMVLLAAASGGLLTVTAINLYGGSLTLLSAADSIRPIGYTRQNRIYSLLLVGAASTAVALLFKGDYVSGFSDLLTILLYLFTPWTSINLIDFYFVRRGCYSIREIFRDDGMYGHWNWRGLTAYAAGFAAMIPFFSTGFYVGPVARLLGGADLAMIIGLPVSAITYLLACRSMDLAAERSRAIEADRGLDSDEPRRGASDR